MAVAGASVVLLALALRCAFYVAVWRNDATLFEHAALVAPQSVRALGGWGEVLAEQGRLAEARAMLDRAVTIAPDFITNRLNRGGVALMSGDLDTAYADAQRVLAIDPGNKAAEHLMSGIARRAGPPAER
jgi:Tfp pilus assembly protein PilF